MKKLLTLSAIVLLVSFSKAPANFCAKNIERSFNRINDNLYFNKYEVSNLDYKVYLASLADKNKTDSYNAALPDTTVWSRESDAMNPFIKYYFRNPSFDNYPVVGVSYENAAGYCLWLTDTYNKDDRRKFAKVMFRLPSRDEWELAAGGGDSKKQFPWGNGFIRNSRGFALGNFDLSPAVSYDSVAKKYAVSSDSQNRLWVMSPVKSFYPSSYGLYNMSGNVAEMIDEKGIAKGGAYDDPAWKVTIASEKKYNGPASDVGFRVVMEILKN